MIDPETLDPDEVLAHLNHLGYQNITEPQLKDFMNDLRKLIEYEQKCIRSYNRSANESDSGSSSTSTCFDNYENDSHTECQYSNTTNSSDLCTDCNIYKTDSSLNTSRESSDIPCSEHKKGKKCHIRPQSSFIRPWKLQPVNKSQSNSFTERTDPVQLYQKYKEIWALNKVPGEKSHSQLRWTIRERMLGQDPQPRPVSQVSGDGRSRSTSCK